MDITKIAIILLFSLSVVSVSAAQEELENQTETPETISDVAVPGDSFYGFKRMSESISLAMARAPIIGGPNKEARVLSKNADERLKEAQILFERNDTDRAQKALERYTESMGAAQKLAEASANNETRKIIADRARNNQEVLQRISQNVPEQARQGIQQALESSRKAQNSLRGPQNTGSNTPFVPPGDTTEGSSEESNSSGELDGANSPFTPPTSGNAAGSSGGGS